MGNLKKTFSNFYCRFIDDIFSLWNGTEIELQEFIEKLNNAILQSNLISNFLKPALKF